MRKIGYTNYLGRRVPEHDTIEMSSKIPTLLTIAGSDPMGGAGIQADIRTASSLGLHVLTAITAVTSQNSKSFSRLGVVSGDCLYSQLNAILEDVTPDAIKIGMVGSVENFEVIENLLKNLSSEIPVVIDPVLSSSIGNKKLVDNLGSKKQIGDIYKLSIFPYATVITPNEQECKLIGGIDNIDLKRISDDPKAYLEKLNVKNAIITGTDPGADELTDILVTPIEVTEKSHSKIDCKNLHGTGCVFSTFIASYLGLGYSLTEAFSLSSERISKIISESSNYSLGISSYGPLNINRYKLL